MRLHPTTQKQNNLIKARNSFYITKSIYKLYLLVKETGCMQFKCRNHASFFIPFIHNKAEFGTCLPNIFTSVLLGRDDIAVVLKAQIFVSCSGKNSLTFY